MISVALGRVLHSLDESDPRRGGHSLRRSARGGPARGLWRQDARGGGRGRGSPLPRRRRRPPRRSTSSGPGEAAGLLLSTFLLVFAAEWGDKSFLATIALAAASNPAGVVLGAVGGHGVATALAVAGGAALSKVVSERTVQYVGGSLFLVFAAATVVDIFRGV